MGLSSRLLRLPRPQRFLYIMSLPTGASLITLSLLLNKLSGLYGILALLTGFHLSPFQLSMYIYSILALALTAYLAPHIRTRSPFHNLALAWFYVLDSIVNAAYTAAFAVSWFLVLAQHNAGNQTPGAHTSAPGAGTIDDTSGFTSPQFNVSKVDIYPDSDAMTVGHPASSPAGSGDTSTALVLSSESLNSIGVIITLWTIRVYFCMIMLSYARLVLRQHIALVSARNNTYSTSTEQAPNPFAISEPAGQGWKGKLGRAMVGLGRTYWLGRDPDYDEEDAAWISSMGGKFRRSAEPGTAAKTSAADSEALSLGERERRRRSGTGPPDPQLRLQSPVGGQGQTGLSVPLQNL